MVTPSSIPIATFGPQAFNFGPSSNKDIGTVAENVYKDGSFLDFVYQVKVTHGIIDTLSVGFFTDDNGAPFFMDAGYATSINGGQLISPGGTVAPVTISRTLAGDVVNFHFNNGLNIPTNAPSGTFLESKVLVLKVLAPDLAPGEVSLIDGGTRTFDAIGAGGVEAPLPATANMGLGLFGVIGAAGGLNALRRRRLASL